MVEPYRDWHERGNCSNHPDPEMWHYENPRYRDEQRLQVLKNIEAIKLCDICPVKAQCLKQGMAAENIEFTGASGSIWGGLLTVERYLLTTDNPKQSRLLSGRWHRNNVRRAVGI